MEEGRGRTCRVEPTGPFEDDPNLTDQRFPGDPTRSYCTRDPLRVIEEITDWQPHPPERVREMRAYLELERQGIEATDERMVSRG